MAAEPVTVVISRRVRPGREADYEAWVHGVTEALASFPGHEGISVLRPRDHAHSEYVLVVRFASYDDLRRWQHSEERARWIARLRDLTVDPGAWQEQTGLETWFTLPGRPAPSGPPPRWKQALLTTVALVPLLLVTNQLVAPLLSRWPAWLRTIVLTPVLVAVMTWLLMPWITRLAFRWLYPHDRPDAAAGGAVG